jgi:gas vesicle protein
MAERAAPNNTLLVSLLAGTAGAALALLFAPRSGRETREHMKHKADDIKQHAEDSIKSARDSIESNIDHAKDRISSTISKTGRKAKQNMEELRNDTDEQQGRRQSPVLTNWEEEV